MNKKDRKTILLVEDDALIAMNEKNQLEKYGYNIIIANTGEKAIEITESSSDIDIILMDINLGIGIDGTEAAEIILKKKDIPVLFLSSYSEKEIVEKTEKITSYGYVVKSSGITVIAASIRMAFRLFESKQEEQKKHRALQESEQKYWALIENSGTYIFIVDKNGIYLLMNTSGASLFGGKPEDFIGKSIFDIVKPKEVAESYYQSNLKIIESGIGRIFENTLDLPVGKRTLLINEQVIKDESGNNVAIQSSSIDITERKQMEDDLVRSNKMLELTQSGANAGSWYWDIVTDKIEWSKNMFEMFDIDKDKNFASFEEWRNTLYPEDKMKAEDKISQVIKNKENLVNDYRIILQDGSIHWIRALGKCEYNDYNEPLRMYGLCMDITEQKKIEDKLQVSENLLKTQFENSPDLIMIIDRNYQIVSLNKILFKSATSATTTDELIGKDSIEILPLHIRETVKSRIEQCFTSGMIQDFEHEVGENIWARARIVPLPLDGIIKNVMIISMDITKRKLTEETLRESEEKYHLLHECAGIGIAYYKLDGTVISYNKQAAQNMGGVPEDFIGRSIYDIFPKKDAEVYHNRIKKTTKSKENIVYEDYFNLPTGNKYFISTFTKIMNSKNELLGIQIISQDITAQKLTEIELQESKERLQYILDNSQNVLYRRNLQDDTYDFMSNSIFQISGFTSEEIVTSPFKKIILNIYPDDLPNIKQAKDQSITNPGKTCQIEYRFKHKQGQLRWFEDHFITILDNQGSPLYMYGSINDITKYKLAEEIIQNQLIEKELLLKEVHHRIKNNISSIGSILKLQAGAITNIEAQNILNDAISRIESMRIIYDKLLKKYDYTDISVKGYFEDLISAILDLFPEKSNIIVERNIDDFMLNVNSLFPIGIIINELITNSMKYAFIDKESGKIDITISKDRNNISLIVQDNGNGLPLDFEVNTSNGFGIILVRSLTEQLKGSLKYENDNGTKCIIEFKI